jgi:hypothetical protein
VTKSELDSTPIGLSGGFGWPFGGGFGGGGFGGRGGFFDDDDYSDDGSDRPFGDDDRARASRLSRMLPQNYAIRAVTGNHRKPCSECGTSDFYPGSFYVYDHIQPWGSDKYCLDCAEMQFGGGGFSGEDDEEDTAGPGPVRHADGNTYDSTGWQVWPPVQACEWGLVYVATGQFRGRFVYYDDEEDEGEAIIYLGRPLVSEGYLVRLSSLRQPPFAGALRSGSGAHDGMPQPAAAAARAPPAPAPPPPPPPTPAPPPADAAAQVPTRRRTRSTDPPAPAAPAASARVTRSSKRPRNA